MNSSKHLKSDTPSDIDLADDPGTSALAASHRRLKTKNCKATTH
ncbi:MULTISPECIES: hypothetical protein [Rhizobium]|nr:MULTISPECIES: hypothetical protein [Rhizobium]